MPHPKVAGNYSGYVTAKKIDKSTSGYFQLVASCKLLKRYDKTTKKEIDLDPPEDITAYLMLTGSKGVNMTQCESLLDAFQISGKVDDGFLLRLHEKDVKEIPLRFVLEVATYAGGKPVRNKDNKIVLCVSFINSANGFGAASEDVTEFLKGGAKGWMNTSMKPKEKKAAKASTTNDEADPDDAPF